MGRGSNVSFYLRGSTTTTSSSTKEVCEASSSDSIPQESQEQQQQLSAWMYWLRDGSLDGNCYTKVFAILKNEFLFLYPQDRRASVGENIAFRKKLFNATNRPLMQIAVAKADISSTGGFRLEDPHGEEMMLYLYNRYDAHSANEWENHLKLAASKTKIHFTRLGSKFKELSRRKSLYVGNLHEYRQRHSVAKNIQTRLHSLRESIFQGTQQNESQNHYTSSSMIPSSISETEAEDDFFTSSRSEKSFFFIQKPRCKNVFQKWRGRRRSV